MINDEHPDMVERYTRVDLMRVITEGLDEAKRNERPYHNLFKDVLRLVKKLTEYNNKHNTGLS